jgi:hypothetical protein
MVNKDHIQKLLSNFFKYNGDSEIQEDGSVNISGDVTMIYAPTNGQIPIKFGIVDGDFRAENKRLSSLLNVPDSCTNLYVSNNLITSLDHCPIYLNTLNVEKNLLTSFVHAPEQVVTIFAFGNPLTSLEGLPDSEYHINITYRERLPLLRLVDAESVHIGRPEGGYARLKPFEPVNSIINKYVGQGKPGALTCAAELIRAGYKENARW